MLLLYSLQIQSLIKSLNYLLLVRAYLDGVVRATNSNIDGTDHSNKIKQGDIKIECIGMTDLPEERTHKA